MTFCSFFYSNVMGDNKFRCIPALISVYVYNTTHTHTRTQIRINKRHAYSFCWQRFNYLIKSKEKSHKNGLARIRFLSYIGRKFIIHTVYIIHIWMYNFECIILPNNPPSSMYVRLRCERWGAANDPIFILWMCELFYF